MEQVMVADRVPVKGIRIYFRGRDGSVITIAQRPQLGNFNDKIRTTQILLPSPQEYSHLASPTLRLRCEHTWRTSGNWVSIHYSTNSGRIVNPDTLETSYQENRYVVRGDWLFIHLSHLDEAIKSIWLKTPTPEQTNTLVKFSMDSVGIYGVDVSPSI